MPQVAKSASKVAKRGPRWAHFGPARLTFEASWAIFNSVTFDVNNKNRRGGEGTAGGNRFKTNIKFFGT